VSVCLACAYKWQHVSADNIDTCQLRRTDPLYPLHLMLLIKHKASQTSGECYGQYYLPEILCLRKFLSTPFITKGRGLLLNTFFLVSHI
jgi:hypothetical protein